MPEAMSIPVIPDFGLRIGGECGEEIGCVGWVAARRCAAARVFIENSGLSTTMVGLSEGGGGAA